jgi:short-subunit dehydrogenase
MVENGNLRRIAILGASRGLGRALCQQWATPENSIWAVSRRIDSLSPESFASAGAFRASSVDLSRSSDLEIWLPGLLDWEPHTVVYVAGGGAFGPFEMKDFKDHIWAWQVSFLSAARVCHSLMRSDRSPQLLLIGSAVAETQGDPHAASYSAAKHALVGLCRSLWLEKPQWDLRLYSPSYMDTDLLPPRARPRSDGSLISSPGAVAEFIVQSASDPAQHGAWWVDSRRVR